MPYIRLLVRPKIYNYNFFRTYMQPVKKIIINKKKKKIKTRKLSKLTTRQLDDNKS